MTDVKIIGVGGAGVNIVNQMLESKTSGGDLVAIDFSGQSLENSRAAVKLWLESSWRGLDGPGKNYSAKDTLIQKHKVRQVIGKVNAVIVTAGLGGSAGSGSTPVILDIVKEQGVFTIAVVNTPFDFEGYHRKETASETLKEITGRADITVIVSAQAVLRLAKNKIGADDAFELLDEIMVKAIRNMIGFLMNDTPLSNRG
jgi:cell division protein FtsZ